MLRPCKDKIKSELQFCSSEISRRKSEMSISLLVFHSVRSNVIHQGVSFRLLQFLAQTKLLYYPDNDILVYSMIVTHQTFL